MDRYLDHRAANETPNISEYDQEGEGIHQEDQKNPKVDTLSDFSEEEQNYMCFYGVKANPKDKYHRDGVL
jgi:hypothetical protein